MKRLPMTGHFQLLDRKKNAMNPRAIPIEIARTHIATIISFRPCGQKLLRLKATIRSLRLKVKRLYDVLMERIENRKVRRDYTILETIEAGIVLSGSEVKSIRAHKASLDGAYVDVSGTKAELLNMDIQPYQPKNMKEGYEQHQPRALLLSRTELAKLADIKKQKGLTIVPLSVYNKGRYLKVSLAVVRGKKKEDKRESLKKQAVERDIGRSLKNR